MSSQNNVQAKSLTLRFFIILGFVFAFSFVSFNSNVYAYPYSTKPEVYHHNHVFYFKDSVTVNNLPDANEPFYYLGWDDDDIELVYTGGQWLSYQFRRVSTGVIVPNQSIPGLTESSTMDEYPVGVFTRNVGVSVNVLYNFSNESYPTIFIESSKEIKDLSGNVVFTDPLKPKYVKFIQPSVNPFLDTTSSYNFLVSYKMSDNTLIENIDIKINGTSINDNQWSITGQQHNKLNGEGWIKFLAVDVTTGSHNVSCTINGTSANTYIERLVGTVDENGDGIDDRTNLPVDDGHADYSNIGGHGIKGALDNLTGFLDTMTSFTTRIFSFFPLEVRWTMIFVIGVMGFIAIKRFIL